MADDNRIGVEEARRAVECGRALLVCAYEDKAKCRQMPLDGSNLALGARVPPADAAQGAGAHLLLWLTRGALLRRSGGEASRPRATRTAEP